MPVPSSTSSSDSARRLLAALAWCALLLLGCRFALGAWGPDVVRPGVQGVALWLQSPAANPVEVLAMGSSRMQTAFAPAVWEEQNALGPGAAANVALVAATFWENLQMLRMAGGLPASTRLVLIEVPRWNFNANRRHAITKQPAHLPGWLRVAAPLRDRLAVDKPLDRLRLLGDWLWPVYQRRPLWSWIKRVTQPIVAEPWLPPATGHWDPDLRRHAGQRQALRAQTIVKDHFHDARMAGFAKRNLELLIDEVHASGARAVLVRIPLRNRYLVEAIRDPDARATLVAANHFVASLAAPDVLLAQCRMARDCGLGPDAFTDYGHMSRLGATEFTRWLSDRIQP